MSHGDGQQCDGQQRGGRHRDGHLREFAARAVGEPDVRLERASEDASFRRYLRVRGRSRTWVLMDAPPERVDCAPYVDVAGRLAAAGLRVPEVVAADHRLGALLLTDFGDTRYLEALDEASADRLYGAAIEALVRMQSRADATGLPEYDADFLRREMALFPEWLLATHLGVSNDGRVQAVLEEAFATLARAAGEQPRVFVHRDYHSRNLMLRPGLRPDGEGRHGPGLLDFQDAVRGPLSYDLVSLLRDVYRRWPPARVDAWMDLYLQHAGRAGLLDGADAATFRRWLDLMGAQRHLKIAGIFARLWHRDGKPGYLADIPLTLEYLVEECAAHPSLASLRALVDELDLVRRVRERNAGVRPASAP